MIIDGIKHKGGKNVKSFLMLGQSNMAGRGEFNEVPIIYNDKCFMLRNGRWQKMSEPVNPDRAIFEGEFHSGVSLAPSFAQSVSDYFGCIVGLIPCADGGTDIDDWAKGGVLYDHAVLMTKLAMRSSDLCGILWHQGESDCFSDSKAKEHKEKFIQMMTAFRKDIGAENIPLIIGELSNEYTDRWGLGDRPNIINHGYKEVTQILSNSALVSASGLKLKEDGIHFNSESLRIFGRRYFDAYLKVLGQNK